MEMTNAQESTAREHLSRAVEVLRSDADRQWHDVSDRVVRQAMTATRRSAPVRAAGAVGITQVSEAVLVTQIRRALTHLEGGSVCDIRVSTDASDAYESVLVLVRVDFGTPIRLLADLVMECTVEALRTTLGPITPTVSVDTLHVHVQDVRALR